MRRVILLIMALLLAVNPVLAGPFENGVAAYDRQDYAAALKLFLPLAKGGNAAAQHNLGVMYDGGIGVPKDDLQAVFWFSQSR